MKTRWKPFIKQVQQQLQQTLSNLSTKHLPPSNQLSLPARAESRAWEPVPTLEQEESYAKHIEEMPATPDWILGLRRDTLFRGPLDEADKETVEVGIVKPSTTNVLMSHIADEPQKFAVLSGPLLAT